MPYPFSTILHKRSSLLGATPALTSLSAGEIAINTFSGKLFTKTDSETIKTFLNSEQLPYTLNEALSSINVQYRNNQVTGILAGVLGGIDNDVSGAGSTVVNGSDNDIAADYAIIGNGSNNKILSGGDFGAILGGQNNTLDHQESFIIGSNITSHLSGVTYVNNLSATGKLYGDGSELTGIVGDVELSTQRTIVDTNFNATSGYFYLVNTTNSPITATLPSNPSIGYNLFFKDPFLTWKTNNFTLNNNTNMIQGLNEFIVCDIDGLGFNLTYIGSTVGWRIE